MLLCDTRSGSTALGHALADSNPGFTFGGELFNPNAVAQIWSFPFWLTERGVSAARLATDKLGVVSDYLSDLLGSCHLPVMVLDVKYHDLPSLLPTPALPTAVPTLFELVSRLDGLVLHLVRRDKGRAALSEIAAVRRGVFHLPDDAIAPLPEPINVDLEMFVQQVRLRVLHETLVRRQLVQSSCRCLEVAYEDVFGERQDEVLAALGEMLAMPVAFNQVRHRRLSSDYEEVFPNSASLLAAADAASKDWPISSLAEIGESPVRASIPKPSVSGRPSQRTPVSRLSKLMRTRIGF